MPGKYLHAFQYFNMPVTHDINDPRNPVRMQWAHRTHGARRVCACVHDVWNARYIGTGPRQVLRTPATPLQLCRQAGGCSCSACMTKRHLCVPKIPRPCCCASQLLQHPVCGLTGVAMPTRARGDKLACAACSLQSPPSLHNTLPCIVMMPLLLPSTHI